MAALQYGAVAEGDRAVQQKRAAEDEEGAHRAGSTRLVSFRLGGSGVGWRFGYSFAFNGAAPDLTSRGVMARFRHGRVKGGADHLLGPAVVRRFVRSAPLSWYLLAAFWGIFG